MRYCIGLLLIALVGCNQHSADVVQTQDSVAVSVVDVIKDTIVIKVQDSIINDLEVLDTIVPEKPVVYVPVINTRERVKVIYDSQIGVRELTGNNDGADVEKYLAYTNLGKGYAWCASFVCWVYGQADVSNPQSAWSPSLLPSSHLVYERGSRVHTGIPQTSDVFGIYFANLKRIAHVGFVDEWSNGSYTITVEGNTNDAGSREGDGVYRKRRLKSQIYKVADYVR